MKMSIGYSFKKILWVVGIFLLVEGAQAGLLFNYSQLALKDLDQMNKLVRAKIAESNKAGGDKAIPLKEALQAIYSRSNEDFMIEKLLPPLKLHLEELDQWEPSIKALTKEAIGALRNPKAFKPVVLVTYQVFLENLISEFKPKSSESFEKSILEQIRDAKIELPKEMVQERKMRVMKESMSPSEIAEKLLKESEDSLAKAAAETPRKSPDPSPEEGHSKASEESH